MHFYFSCPLNFLNGASSVTVFAFFEKKKTETHFSEENSKMAIRFLRAGWIELGLEQQIEAYKKL